MINFLFTPIGAIFCLILFACMLFGFENIFAISGVLFGGYFAILSLSGIEKKKPTEKIFFVFVFLFCLFMSLVSLILFTRVPVF